MAAARLVHFVGPGQVPGAYWVTYKTSSELAGMHVGAGIARPDLMPITSENAQTLSSVLAKQVSALAGRQFRIQRRYSDVFHSVTRAALTALAKDPRVESIEPLHYLKTNTTENLSYWGDEWKYLDRIDQRSLPLVPQYTYTTTASNVLVVVVDSGIVGEDLGFQGRVTDVHDCMVTGGFLSPCGQVVYPHQSITNSYGTFTSNDDCEGHGTIVAGIVGDENAGVAKAVKMSAAIVTDSCNVDPNVPGGTPGNTADLVAGVEYYVSRKGGDKSTPYVMNMSIESVGLDSQVDGAVKDAIKAGIAVVVAAGNDNADACTNSPADLAPTTAVVSVGATYDDIDERWTYRGDPSYAGSDYGRCVTLFSPGETYQDESFDEYQAGTSIAAPVVAGIAALYLSTTPTAPPTEVKAAIVAAATSGTLATSGTNSIEAGSPNLLAYSLVPAGAPPGYVPPPPGLSQQLKTTLAVIVQYLLNFPNGR